MVHVSTTKNKMGSSSASRILTEAGRRKQNQRNTNIAKELAFTEGSGHAKASAEGQQSRVTTDA